MGAQVSHSVASVMSGAGVIANPTVVCDPNFTTNATLGNPNGNLFSGLGEISLQGNRITYGYLVLNADTGSAKITNISSLALSIAVAHEIGHMIGLGHSADSAALMYYNLSSKTKLNLAQDDIDGISYLYPRNELNGNPFGCGTVTHTRNFSFGFLNLLILLLPLIFSIMIKKTYVSTSLC
jgi:hypothetical protein